MRKVVLNLAVSLDGYISRVDGNVDWLDNLNTDGSDLGFQHFLSSCDTILMGRVSYEDTLKLGNGNWEFRNHKTYVFTHRNIENQNGVRFVFESPKQVIKKLRKENGKDIWLFGGGNFIKTMREYNLIDEYIFTIIPVFLGKGIRLFQDINRGNKLELIATDIYNDIIQCHYKVIKL